MGSAETLPAAIDEAAPVQRAAIIDPVFAPGFRNLTDDRGDWRWAGDGTDQWVLLGVQLTNGRSDQVWFVRMAVAPEERQLEPTRQFTVPAPVGAVRRGTKYTAPAETILIQSFDRNGAIIHDSESVVPKGVGETSLESLGRSLADGDQSTAQTRGGRPDPAADGAVSLVVGLRTISRSIPIKPIRDAARRLVIQEPGILSIILSGFKVDVRGDFTQGQELSEPWLPGIGGSPQYLAQSPLFIAGTRLTEAQLVVGPTEPPFNLTAGMLAMEIVHPRHPSQKLSVRVLAASPGR